MQLSTMISDRDDIWRLTFGIDFTRRRNTKIWVKAVNQRTKESLMMPQDRDRLTALLPWDMWPAFATDEFSIEQPTLEGFSLS